MRTVTRHPTKSALSCATERKSTGLTKFKASKVSYLVYFWGASKRKEPIGGWAYGIPRNSLTYLRLDAEWPMICPWDVRTVAPGEPSAEQGNRALAKPIKGNKNITPRFMMRPATRPFTKARAGRVQLTGNSNALFMLEVVCHCQFAALERLRANCRALLYIITAQGRSTEMRALGCSGHSQLPLQLPCTEAPLPACIFRNSVREAKEAISPLRSCRHEWGCGSGLVGVPGRLTGSKDTK